MKMRSTIRPIILSSFAAGFVLATAALHAAGTLSAMKLRRWPGMIRAAGFATSLVGMFLAVQTV